MDTFMMIALDDLELEAHSWTKGLDYEVVQKEDYFILASDEGQMDIMGIAKERLVGLFELEVKN